MGRYLLKRLLIAIERSERNIAEPKMQLLTEGYRHFGIVGNEGQRKSAAEELYDFASSHIRMTRLGRLVDLKASESERTTRSRTGQAELTWRYCQSRY